MTGVGGSVGNGDGGNASGAGIEVPTASQTSGMTSDNDVRRGSQSSHASRPGILPEILSKTSLSAETVTTNAMVPPPTMDDIDLAENVKQATTTLIPATTTAPPTRHRSVHPDLPEQSSTSFGHQHDPSDFGGGSSAPCARVAHSQSSPESGPSFEFHKGRSIQARGSGSGESSIWTRFTTPSDVHRDPALAGEITKQQFNMVTQNDGTTTLLDPKNELDSQTAAVPPTAERKHFSPASVDKRPAHASSRTSTDDSKSTNYLTPASSEQRAGEEQQGRRENGVSGFINLSHTRSSDIGSSSTSGNPRSRSDAHSTGSMRHKHRKSKADTRLESVQTFVTDQSHTTGFCDPNTPTARVHSAAGFHSESDSKQPVEVPPKLLDDSSVRIVNLSEVNKNDNDNSTGKRGAGSGGARSDIVDESSIKLPSHHNSDTHIHESDGAGILVHESSSVADSSSSSASKQSGNQLVMTSRYEYQTTKDGHHVVCGREGKLERCEDEPITTPGAVQGFGVLMVIEEEEETGDLTVRQVSENSTQVLGLSPQYLFRLQCLTHILPRSQENTLRDNIEYLVHPDVDGHESDEGPQVFLLSGYGEPGSEDSDEMPNERSINRRREWTCWVAAHRPSQKRWDKVDEQGRPIPPPLLVVLEFELERDIYNPLHPSVPSDLAPGGVASSKPEKSVRTVPSSTDTSSNPGSKPSATVIGDVREDQTAIDRPKPSVSGDTADGADAEDEYVFQDPAAILESTTCYSKPIRALERMRQKTRSNVSSSAPTWKANGGGHGVPVGESETQGGNGAGRQRNRRNGSGAGGVGTMDVFAVLSQINDQLSAALDLESFLKVVVGVIKDLTQFHRVMVYSFDSMFNGQVVSELVDREKSQDLYRGLMVSPCAPKRLMISHKIASNFSFFYLSSLRQISRYKLESSIDGTRFICSMTEINRLPEWC